MPLIENSCHLQPCAKCEKPIFYAAGCFYNKKDKTKICLSCYKEQKKMKLIVGNRYGSWIYEGIREGIWYNCDLCGKERLKTHWFYKYNNNQDVEKYGTGCIKDALRELVNRRS
jgi:hypothetical protein